MNNNDNTKRGGVKVAKKYNVFLLEAENPNDIPTYIDMLSPLNWNISTFTSAEQFIQMMLKSKVKPDIIISSYSIAPLALRTANGNINVGNSLDLMKIMIQSGFMKRVPTVLVMSHYHTMNEYNHCNENSVPYLTRGKFEAETLVETLQYELRNYFNDSSDYLYILQNGHEPQSNFGGGYANPVDMGMSFQYQQNTPKSMLDIHADENRAVQKTAQVISFYNGGKGGVGKTTLATSFATLLSANGSKVLLIDADFYAPNAYFLLKVKPTRTIIDLKHMISNLTDSTFEDCVIKHGTGIHFLPGPVNPKDVEMLFPNDLLDIIKFAKKRYEYIIVDLPPKLPDEDHLVDTIAHISDKIVQVTTQSFASIYGVTKAFEILASEGVDPNKFYLCVNGLNPKINLDPESIATQVTAKKDYAQVLKNGRIPVVGKIGSDDNIPTYEAAMELYVLNTKTKFRRDMEHMVMNLLPGYKINNKNLASNEPKKEMKSNKSFLGGLFKKKK